MSNQLCHYMAQRLLKLDVWKGQCMDDQDKVREIKKRLEEIAQEALRLGRSIERIRQELERIRPRPSNGDKK